MTDTRKVLDYTNRDFTALRSWLVGVVKGVLPEWETVGETGDFGTLLLEMYAFVGDVMNYYIDRVGAEAFLGTAIRRQSVLYIADMMGYSPIGQRAAYTTLQFTWQFDPDTALSRAREYEVVSGYTDNGVVTMRLHHDELAVAVVPGQTIEIANVKESGGDPGPFNGNFIVKTVEVIPNTDGDVTITYNVLDTNDYTIQNPSNGTATVGMALLIPSGTRVYTNPDMQGNSVSFETLSDLLLDASAAIQTDPSTRSVTASVQAAEGTTVSPTLVGVSKGVANAEFEIPTAGVIDGTVEIYTKEGGQTIVWSQISRLALATPTQSVFAVYVDDNNVSKIVFGDGVNGRVPPINSEIYVGYRYGVGAAGNSLGTNTLVNYANAAASDQGVTVTNTVSPSGGADVESVESMRYSIARSNSVNQRAITTEDFQQLALQVPGIAKAVAYGDNYSSTFIRIAANDQSLDYLVKSVSFASANANNEVTLVLDSIDSNLSYGADFYLQGLAENTDIPIPNDSYVVDSVFQTGSGLAIDLNVTEYDVGYAVPEPLDFRNAPIVRVHTDGLHGLQNDQPVRITGTDNSNFNEATYIVQNAHPTWFEVTTDEGSATPDESTRVRPQAGLKFDIASGSDEGLTIAATPIKDVASSSATVTYTDVLMGQLIESLEVYLSDKKMVGSVVYGEPVVWTDVDLKVFLRARKLYNRGAVRAAVQAAIEEVFAFDNVSFGQRISIGDVYRAAMAVDGVDYIIIEKMYAKDADMVNPPYTGSGVNDIETLPYNLPRLRSSETVWLRAKGGLPNT